MLGIGSRGAPTRPGHGIGTARERALARRRGSRRNARVGECSRPRGARLAIGGCARQRRRGTMIRGHGACSDATGSRRAGASDRSGRTRGGGCRLANAPVSWSPVLRVYHSLAETWAWVRAAGPVDDWTPPRLVSGRSVGPRSDLAMARAAQHAHASKKAVGKDVINRQVERAAAPGAPRLGGPGRLADPLPHLVVAARASWRATGPFPCSGAGYAPGPRGQDPTPDARPAHRSA
jgi:hypothetical protein